MPNISRSSWPFTEVDGRMSVTEREVEDLAIGVQAGKAKPLAKRRLNCIEANQ